MAHTILLADGTTPNDSTHRIGPPAALDTPIDAFIVAATDTYSTDSTISLPADGGWQISFAAPWTTWYGAADAPRACPELSDTPLPVKLRQHSYGAASTLNTFTTAGTDTAITALGTVAGFTATAGDTTVALAWTATTNASGYIIEWGTTTGYGSSITIASGATVTYSHTGRTNGTLLYYRIHAVGTGRYSDGGTATASATPASTTLTTAGLLMADDFNRADTAADEYIAVGGVNKWQDLNYTTVTSNAFYGNYIRNLNNALVWHAPTHAGTADSAVPIPAVGISNTQDQAIYTTAPSTSVGTGIGLLLRATTDTSHYLLFIQPDGATIYKRTPGGYAVLGSKATFTLGTGDRFLFVASGGSTTTLKAYRNGTQICGTQTDSSTPLTTGVPGVRGQATNTTDYNFSYAFDDIVMMVGPTVTITGLPAGHKAALYDGTTETAKVTASGGTATVDGSALRWPVAGISVKVYNGSDILQRTTTGVFGGDTWAW